MPCLRWGGALYYDLEEDVEAMKYKLFCWCVCARMCECVRTGDGKFKASLSFILRPVHTGVLVRLPASLSWVAQLRAFTSLVFTLELLQLRSLYNVLYIMMAMTLSVPCIVCCQFDEKYSPNQKCTITWFACEFTCTACVFLARLCLCSLPFFHSHSFFHLFMRKWCTEAKSRLRCGISDQFEPEYFPASSWLFEVS